jgi:hypothetical protein
LCDTLAGMLNQHQNRTFNLAPLPPLAWPGPRVSHLLLNVQ